MFQLDILLNGQVVEELSSIVHVSKAKTVGKNMVTRLLDILPKQQFLVSIQESLVYSA